MSESPPTIEAIMAETDALFSFAVTRLPSAHDAEDVVQDTVVTAWRSREAFTGASTLRTWLTGILRHKILDFHRAQTRTPTRLASKPAEDAEDSDPLDLLFDKNGSWKIHPHAGLSFLNDTPRHAATNSEILGWIRRCVAALPSTSRLLFQLRELDGNDLKPAAQAAGVTDASASVLLVRAKHQLRLCLSQAGVKP